MKKIMKTLLVVAATVCTIANASAANPNFPLTSDAVFDKTVGTTSFYNFLDSKNNLIGSLSVKPDQYIVGKSTVKYDLDLSFAEASQFSGKLGFLDVLYTKANQQAFTFHKDFNLSNDKKISDSFEIQNGYAYKSSTLSFSPAPVPEPETYAMLLAGLCLIGGIARRRTKTV